MNVRAKFCVTSVEMFSGQYGQVKMSAIHETDTPENRRFTKATPNGTIQMAIDNPPALEQFKPGDYFYVEFTPVKENKE